MKKLISLLLAAMAVFSATAQTVPEFRNNDRIVFTGNSITDGGHYHSYIWLYYITHFPNRYINIFNAGIGGEVAAQMYDRLQTDVFSRNPTVVLLTFGMNDTGYQFLQGTAADSAYQAKIKSSLLAFGKIVEVFRRHTTVQKILIGSSPYDETSAIKARPLTGKNAAMLRINVAQQDTAAKYKWGYVDFNRPMVAINKQQQLHDSTFTLQGADRIHPTNDGHMVMAYLFLKAQGLANKKVAAVTIDKQTNKVLTDNCKVTALHTSADKISFSYLANALPYPVDTIPQGANSPHASQADALKLVPFTKEFNQELLCVKGLQAGNYNLQIDGQLIGTWPANDWQKGINLAELYNTPQYQQALALLHINEERWQIERRLREYYWLHYSILKPKGRLFDDSPATVDSLQRYAAKDFFVAVTLPGYRNARFKAVRDTWEQEIALLTKQLYSLNKPMIHHFEISIAK